ncbi:MAG: hypothetical protein AAFN10_27335 [Bacteroidota bacterium]
MAKNKANPKQSLQALPQGQSVTATLQVDIKGELPDLKGVQARNVNMAMEYWTPQSEGEAKTLIFIRVKGQDQIPDFNDPANLVEKDCAYFIEQTEEGFQILRNASSRLVSMARNFLEGEVYRITFKGMRPNKTNNNKSNFWAIQPVAFAA